ncbi:TetR/AcrR family transcriptional regulator [Pseudonocardia acaciae]|uniref:TetR/AcrR family transcriptional regulator n=1 Tax=Pseudonocardia acaciae TaxID=551276 RepID=UPI00056B12BB|nr:TetR family transcriptional regulator [Pseudonocardia acaciae]
MTVNKVGRPSKAAERRAHILEAMAAEVAGHGLAEVTVAKVAQRAGLQRTLVFHYFGDRDALVRAFLDEVVGRYGETMVLGDPGAPFRDRLDLAFEPGFYQQREHLVVWTELVALAAREPSVRDRLLALWRDRWLPEVERQLRRERPHATPAQVGRTAYGLACLVEGHWALYLQGLDDPARARAARDAARTLVDALPAAPP